MEKENFTQKLNDIFNHLHQNAEISHEETETTQFIYNQLKQYDCRITTFENQTGLYADIGQGSPVVAVRADIDALWQEINGQFQANHSCGHDAHMTIVLGTFMQLVDQQDQLNGTVRFIFQPAEEKGTGALQMVEQSAVDGVDYLYGMHLRPIQELTNGRYAPAIRHGASRFVSGVITGEDAHGARPHLNSNAIQIGAELVQLINNIHLDPMIPHSMKVTSFHSGGKSTNIIPGKAEFSIDMRAQSNELMDEMQQQLESTVSSLAKLRNVGIDLSIGANLPAALINDDAHDHMEKAIADVVGEEHLHPMITTTGGDDFHFYSIKRPELKATMLAIGCDLKPGLHHPYMTFNHDVIPEASDILTRAILNTLGE
ncbi:M20 peptidase aminoacylase family protein [Aquisalibacillus elongatus]|uniref:Amidohydrolase n=1 Tax=Aquisalibacillus elongatus TaxID=485577 RepID=A0A3N5B922_9BACI|nr:M20 peptidase aminoacylase family protein [Aquisalibacillus elongatus]RPF54226.1 amidohydrolase [Aquisalibacillus elongatus]